MMNMQNFLDKLQNKTALNKFICKFYSKNNIHKTDFDLDFYN
jgi:hypothetical protein